MRYEHNCSGCGISAARILLARAAADRDIQVVHPGSCGVAATSAPGIASGLAAVARLNGEDTRIVCWVADRGVYDESGDVLYIYCDTEFGGGPEGHGHSKDIVGMVSANGARYAAAVSLAHPDDAMRKMRYALDAEGFRFLHILAPCPTVWQSEPARSIELVRLAVRSGLFAVCEVFDGTQTVVNVEPESSQGALTRYFALQGRFRETGPNAGAVLEHIARSWLQLRARESC